MTNFIIGDTVIDFALVEVIYPETTQPRVWIKEIYSEGPVIKKEGRRVLDVNLLLLYKINDNEDQYKMVKDIFYVKRVI